MLFATTEFCPPLILSVRRMPFPEGVPARQRSGAQSDNDCSSSDIAIMGKPVMMVELQPKTSSPCHAFWVGEDFIVLG
jgi:hypothetical protein